MKQAITFLVLVLPLGAQNPFSGNARETDAGRGLFRIMCAPCHGIQAKGGRGPDLTLGVFHAGESDRDLFRVIADGVTGTEMPGYQTRIGDDNIWRLISYIRSVSTRRTEPVTGNAANGEKLFWSKHGCGNCHRAGLRGGASGPDLTRVGRKRSLAYLRQSITEPNADVTPGYYKITVTRMDGSRITGVQRGFDNFSAQLMTADGKLYSFSRAEVQSAEREYVSVMPPYNRLPAAEIDDLVAYLASLKGEQQ